MDNINLIKQRLCESGDLKLCLSNNDTIISEVSNLANLIVETISNGGKIILCGNGGSASDALHFAGEILGRFQRERKAWPAIVLNADVATMTAIANDYGYDEIFARQVEGLMNSKDLFIGISTSGNSVNIIKAVEKIHEIGGKTAALLGKDGGKLTNIVDLPIVVNSNTTARVQECHITIIHIVCEIIENILKDNI